MHDSVAQHSNLVDDKRKEIQESTHKLVEVCNNIVGLSLQQTTWLRKQFAVKLGTMNNASSGSLASQVTTNGSVSGIINPSYGIHQIVVDTTEKNPTSNDDENLNGNLSDSGIDHFINDIDNSDPNNNIMRSYQALNILATVKKLSFKGF